MDPLPVMCGTVAHAVRPLSTFLVWGLSPKLILSVQYGSLQEVPMVGGTRARLGAQPTTSVLVEAGDRRPRAITQTWYDQRAGDKRQEGCSRYRAQQRTTTHHQGTPKAKAICMGSLNPYASPAANASSRPQAARPRVART